MFRNQRGDSLIPLIKFNSKIRSRISEASKFRLLRKITFYVFSPPFEKRTSVFKYRISEKICKKSGEAMRGTRRKGSGCSMQMSSVVLFLYDVLRGGRFITTSVAPSLEFGEVSARQRQKFAQANIVIGEGRGRG